MNDILNEHEQNDKLISMILILVTVPNPEIGSNIANQLIDRNLCACVNIIPGLRSIYKWKGELCDESEHLLLIKSTVELQGDLEQAVVELHPYEVPEFIVLSPLHVSEAYLSWIKSSVSSQ